MKSEAVSGSVRPGRISDYRALGNLYSARSATDRRLFHPFPGGRFTAPLIFLILLTAQRFYRSLVRLHPSWGFLFIVHPGPQPGTLDGSVYLRVRRATPAGFVANIGTQVGPTARGKGVGPEMITALMARAQRHGVYRIETGVYEKNAASIRMCEKLGFRFAEVPPHGRGDATYGPELLMVRDLAEPAESGAAASFPAVVLADVRGDASPHVRTAASRRELWRTAEVWAALLGSFALIALARLILLFQYPYPPSGDVAEQLYWTHIWLGTAFPSPATVWWIPPVYIFTVYLPFIHFFPLFTGQRLLMGIVPALLVFPTYWLLRQSNVNRAFSVFGAALLALAPTVSLMVTWNAGYNLFGMVWAMFFFAALVGALRTFRRNYILLAGLGFGLTAGTHYFTFVFVLVAFVFIAVLALVLMVNRAQVGRLLVLVLAAGALFAAPFALVYYTLLQQTGNVGGPVSLAAVDTLLQQLLPFAAGAQALGTPVVYFAAAISLAGVVVLVVARIRKPETSVFLGIILAGLALSVAYPQEADRGLYFIPLGLYPIVAVLFQVLYEKIPSWVAARRNPTTIAAETPVTSDSTGSPGALQSRWRSGRRTGWIAPTVAVAVMAAFVFVNAQQSLVVMSQADAFYETLDPQDIPVLNWLAHDTPADAAIFSSSEGLEKWIWGYSNRQAFAPTSLDLQATTLSYQETYESDLAALGEYVSGNGYLAVSENAPAPVGEPLIYLRSSSDWTLLLSTGAADVNFTVVVAGQSETLNLADALLASNATQPSCSACADESLTFSWPGTGVSVVQTTNVSGEDVGLSWRATGAQLSGVSFTTYLTPSSFGAGYVVVPAVTGNASLTDRFSFNGDPLAMTLTGSTGSFEQTGLSTGWTKLTYRGLPAIDFDFQGLGLAASGPPFSVGSPAIFDGLNVSYVVTDYNDSVPGYGYLLYLRCATPNETPGVNATEVFRSGSIYVFALDPS